MSKLSLTYCFVMMFAGTLFSQISHFNNKTIEVKDSTDFSFIVSGHFHGASNNISGFPASSILANIDKLNASEASFLVCLGDMFLDVPTDYTNYQNSFFSKLDVPLFNVVGNHDLGGDFYETNFGKTYFSFSKNESVFVFLDTEMNDGSLEGEQLSMLKEALSNSFKNVFIFSHRLIWAEGDKEISPLFPDNTQSYVSNNFTSDIEPLLKQSESKVYWFSGSLGGAAPASFFYYPKDNITYIATAIRNLPRDAYLQVKLRNNNIEFETHSLNQNTTEPLENYDLSYWKSNKTIEQFNFKLLPMYIKQMFKHWFFYVGLLIGASLISLFFIRKRKA